MLENSDYLEFITGAYTFSENSVIAVAEWWMYRVIVYFCSQVKKYFLWEGYK